MREERLNVLSIDWDYFINASIGERLELFPDGGNENLPDGLGQLIWSGRYIDGRLNNIKTDTKAIRRLKKCIRNQSLLLETMIVDSHRYAYDFIKDYMFQHDYDSVNLVNIDFHHDVYDFGTDEVDCGNWLRILMKDLEDSDSKFTWVCREDSDDLRLELFDLEKTTSLDIIDEDDWDIIFICRSGMWSPPHLDKNFMDCFKWLLEYGGYVRYQESIMKKSRMSGMKELINSQIKAKEEFMRNAQ